MANLALFTKTTYISAKISTPWKWLVPQSHKPARTNQRKVAISQKLYGFSAKLQIENLAKLI